MDAFGKNLMILWGHNVRSIHDFYENFSFFLPDSFRLILGIDDGDKIAAACHEKYLW